MNKINFIILWLFLLARKCVGAMIDRQEVAWNCVVFKPADLQELGRLLNQDEEK